MSRTYRKPRPRFFYWHKKYLEEYWLDKKGRARDGAPTHVSSSCESHGGCPYCLSSILYRTKKRMPIEEDY